jgi:hypothetical protein
LKELNGSSHSTIIARRETTVKNARFHGAEWGPDAWLTNEWNGAVPGGSGEVWHYKIIWVGPELEESPYWREGCYPIWGEFEVIMDQGTWSDHTHEILALATPNGFGVGGQ